MKLQSFACACITALSFVAGCGASYDRTEISAVVKPSIGDGSINQTAVSVPEGAVLKAHITSYNTDDDIIATSVRTDDASIMDVSPLTTGDDWAFIGRKAGQTRVSILVDGSPVMVLQATVVAQSSTQQ